jgi:SAM-dependent methyltransferase
MHQTALQNAKLFFDCYGKHFKSGEKPKVVDIGSQDVNGSIKDVCPSYFQYIGVDFIQAKNVDIVLTDPYKLPFEDKSVDIITSSSCFEHSEMFWLSYLEILRVLKPKGIFYLNAPSRGDYHRYPVDCYRFYPDCGVALARWGEKNNYENILLESYIDSNGEWGDYVGIFLKDKSFQNTFLERILDFKKDYINGKKGNEENILNMSRSNYKKIKYKNIKKIYIKVKIFLQNFIE